MSILYSDVIWLGAVVLVLGVGALIGLWRRPNLDAFEPIKPTRLAPAQRDLLLLEKTLAIEKALAAKNASRMARRERRRQLAAQQALEAKIARRERRRQLRASQPTTQDQPHESR